MKHVTILATSLNAQSRSQELGKLLHAELQSRSVSVELIDLRTISLPLVGSAESWESDGAELIQKAIEKSSHVIFASPIYCYDLNAVAKTIIEHKGKSLAGKVVAFACSAGGANSYMAPMGFANHLMLDFRAVIVPRFLYVDSSQWENGQLNESMQRRLVQLVDDMSSISVA